MPPRLPTAAAFAGVVLTAALAAAVADGDAPYCCPDSKGCGGVIPAGQLQLAWNACEAGGGQQSLNWACDGTQTDRLALVGSFTVSETMEYFFATDINMFLEFPEITGVPDWWQMGDPPACRANSIEPSGAKDDPCPSPWDGQSTALITRFEPRFAGSGNLVFVKLAIARHPNNGVTLTADQNYTVFKLLIDRRRTTGPDACTGCDAAVQVHFCHMVLYNNPPPPQTGTAWGFQMGSTVFGQFGPTPVKNRTWGAIKSLYR